MEPATLSNQEEKPDKPKKEDEPEKIKFSCKACAMFEEVDYFGKSPPFTKNLELHEDSYVMRDPFTAPPTKHGKRSFTEYFIVVGSHCLMCDSVFCKDCSLFYNGTFCYACAQSQIYQFPLEIQSKIRKEILEIKRKC